MLTGSSVLLSGAAHGGPPRERERIVVSDVERAHARKVRRGSQIELLEGKHLAAL